MREKTSFRSGRQPESCEKIPDPLRFHADDGGRFLTVNGYDPDEIDLRHRLSQIDERLAGIAHAEREDAAGRATGWPVANQVYADLRAILDHGRATILKQLKELE